MIFKLNGIKVLLSIIGGILFTVFIQHFIASKFEYEFKDESQKLINTVNSALDLYKISLANLQSLYQVNQYALDFNSFENYNQQASENANFVIGASFYRYYSNTYDLKAFEDEMRNKTNSSNKIYTSFKLDPKEIQHHNLFIQYKYPFQDFRKSIGRNILKYKGRNDAIEYAIQYNLGVTRKIQHQLSNNTYETLIFFMPIFKNVNNLSKVSADQRNFENLYGFVSITINTDALFKQLLNKNTNSNLAMQIIDITDLSPSSIIDLDTIEILNYQFPINHYYLQRIEKMELGGRIWKFTIQASNQFIPLEWRLLSYVIGILGFILTWLIYSQVQYSMMIQKQNHLLQETTETLLSNEDELYNVINAFPMVFAITNIQDSQILLHNQRMIDVFQLTKSPKYARDYYASLEQREIFLNQVIEQKG